MKKYETIFVIRPNASEEIITAATGKAQEQVTRNGGIVLGLENWGTKKLAYEIPPFMDGIYIKMDIEAPGDVIAILARHFKLSEDVIRYQTVKAVEKKATAG